MKLKVRLGRESRVIDLDGDPSTLTLGQLREAAAQQFALQDHDFQQSLNKRDFFTGDEQPLSEFGLVSGDLLHITGTGLPEPPPQQQQQSHRTQPLATYSTPGTSSQIYDDRGSMYSRDTVTESVTNGSSSQDQRATATGSHMDGRETVLAGASNTTEEEEMVTDVNRGLQEPLVIRESTASQVPILLHQLYSSANCGNRSDALWVVVHALMMEAGFIPCECPEPTEMPESWKRPGFYTCSYLYNVTADITSTCSVTGVTLGASIAVHAIPRTETGFKTDTVHLNSSQYVRELCEDTPSVYRALDKLSRQIKDSICLPVINELVTTAGYRENQGLLAMPSEVTLRILTYLDAVSLCHLAQTCQEMRSASNDRMVWRHLYIRDFGRLSDSSLNRPWAQLYREKQEEVREEWERRRQQELLLLDPIFPPRPGVGPFRPFPPEPMNIIGGDYDLNPEFAAGMPPLFGGRGGNPLRLPGPGRNPLSGLDPFSANPLQPRGRGNMTGSPFANPFRGPFL